MIKFTFDSKKPGVKVLGIGLSRLNCERLLAGQPIPIDLAEMGVSHLWDIVIMGGETELTIKAELEAAGMEMPPPDKIHIDPRLL